MECMKDDAAAVAEQTGEGEIVNYGQIVHPAPGWQVANKRIHAGNGDIEAYVAPTTPTATTPSPSPMTTTTTSNTQAGDSEIGPASTTTTAPTPTHTRPPTPTATTPTAVAMTRATMATMT
ncbi:hypothetical protein EDB85DRAFT_1892074 [Lactarius pseudohatsudake]|nr:hypothetical protein EDB85DRAFT_1892074 [Lactarius pseudohatsudake]